MRTAAFILLLMAALALGCQDNAAQQYGSGLINAKEKAKDTAATVDLEGVRRVIASYYAANEKYPASIEELTKISGQDIDPAHYEYDPASGRFWARK